MERKIYITEDDLKNIRKALQDPTYNNLRNKPYIEQLQQELERAVICPSTDIPADVITMHSRVVLLDLESREETELTLVYPGEPTNEHDVSVLAPIGIAMIGYRLKDVFEWETPGGMRRLQVKNVLFQPESAERKAEV
ncbi:MAG: GreA/GreB family elongation factor [Anaerolineae bacterium]|nr:GreA/GreB family elongation factor [Anaerolineae bacterium]